VHVAVALLSGMLNSVGKFVERLRRLHRPQPHMMAATFVALGLGLRNEPLAGVVQAWGVFAAGLLQLRLLVDGVRRNDLRIRLGGRA
jgi:putative peptidoglycan lipid II flippase